MHMPPGHPALVATGWFTELYGPFGGCPVQLLGRLSTGEHVYFRAREGKVTLSIAYSEDDATSREGPHLADYQLGMKTTEDAGLLPHDLCAAIVFVWVAAYMKEHHDSCPCRLSQAAADKLQALVETYIIRRELDEEDTSKLTRVLQAAGQTQQ